MERLILAALSVSSDEQLDNALLPAPERHYVGLRS